MNELKEIKSPTQTMSIDECNDTVCSGSQFNESLDTSIAFDDVSVSEGKVNCPPDLLKEGLDIVFVGINTQLVNADNSHHYSGPGNHLWTCLHLAQLIPFEATCNDDHKLLAHGIGFTNICTRPLKGAQELTRGEMRQGAAILTEKVKKYKPKMLAFNGKGIYEAYLGNKNFSMGKQPRNLDGTDTVIFVMPSSSARCAQLPRAEDKMPFFHALKKLRDFLRGDIDKCDDKEVTFSDYTEFRVTTPDPKSVRKAERRRKRKALAALMMDQEGYVPTESDVRNLVENKIIDAHDDTKKLAEAVLEKKVVETTSSPLLMRLKNVMSLNLSPEALQKRTQEAYSNSPAKQNKQDAKNKSMNQVNSPLTYPNYSMNNSGLYLNNATNQVLSLSGNNPYAFQSNGGHVRFASNSQGNMVVTTNFQPQQQQQINQPQQSLQPQQQQQQIFITQNNPNLNSIQFVPMVNNATGNSGAGQNFRFLVPQSPMVTTNLLLAQSNLQRLQNQQNQLITANLLRNEQLLRKVNPLGEFIDFLTDSGRNPFSLIDRATQGDEKLAFAAL